MALLFNPLHLLVVPFLFLLSFVLATFATITTTLALCVLGFRAFIVYLDLIFSVFPRSFLGFSPSLGLSFSGSRQRYKYTPSDLPSKPQSLGRIQIRYFNGEPPLHGPSLSSTSLNLARRRRRRPSSTSIVSGGSITPVGAHSRNVSNTSLGLLPSTGPDRDFEGIGGWRTADDKDDDQVWTTINAKSSEWTPHHYRHHSRTASGGMPTTPGEYLMMKSRARSPGQKTDVVGRMTSPNSSRARTPSGPGMSFVMPVHSHGADGYFALTMGSKSKKSE